MTTESSGVSVVTGAASGIGAAIATRFATTGGRVVLVDVDADRGAARDLGSGGLPPR